MLIEVLLSRHEALIDKRVLTFARRFPDIGEDAVRSTFLLRLTKSCIRHNNLLDLQDENLTPRDLTAEKRIIGGIIKFACVDEWRKLRRNGFSSQSFSQLGEFDPGQIPQRVTETPAPVTAEERIARIREKLQQLNIELTTRQFNILVCKLTSTAENGGVATYQQIAHQLHISDTTVRRDMSRIKRAIHYAKTGETIDRAPETIRRREDFKQILANAGDLKEDLREYMEIYVELTADDQRPNEQEMCARLNITEHQLKNRQRRAKLLRSSPLNGIA